MKKHFTITIPIIIASLLALLYTQPTPDSIYLITTIVCLRLYQLLLTIINKNYLKNYEVEDYTFHFYLYSLVIIFIGLLMKSFNVIDLKGLAISLALQLLTLLSVLGLKINNTINKILLFITAILIIIFFNKINLNAFDLLSFKVYLISLTFNISRRLNIL